MAVLGGGRELHRVAESNGFSNQTSMRPTMEKIALVLPLSDDPALCHFY